MSPSLRRALFWGGALLLLVGVYALLGFLLAPRLIRSGVQDFVSEHYHRHAEVGVVRFNPFTLRLEVNRFIFPDEDAQPLLSFGRLVVDLDMSSVWRRAPSFAEITLDEPFARVQIRKSGALNLADLAKPFANDKTPPAADSKPARLFIDRFTVRSGSSTFEDQTRAQPFRAELKPITFDLRNFSTTEQTGNGYALAAVSEAGERFNWSGVIRLNPLASKGEFELSDVQVHTLWSYLSDSLHFETTSGVLGLKGDYDFNAAGSAIGLKVNVHELAVTNLGVKPKGAAANAIDVARLEVHETSMDADKHTVSVGKVQLMGGDVRAWLDDKGRLSLLDLVGPASNDATAGSPAADVAASSESASQTPSVATSGPAQKPWTVSAPDISVDGLKVALEDRQVSPAVALAIAPINVHVGGFSTASDARLAITANAGINTSGKLVATANVTPASGAVSADVELTQLDLTAFQPYLSKETLLTLLSGELGTKMHVERAADGALTIEGDADVAKLRTIDNDLKLDFVKWDHLRVQKLRYQSAPASLQIGTIVAQAPYARVIIAKDRTVNVSDVLRPMNAPATAPAADVAPPREASGPAKHSRSNAATATAKSPAPAAPTMALSIGTVRIVNGSANFADLWIQPNFAVGIQTLNGSIAGLSSNPRSRAKVDLEGKVDRYAPAVIHGEVNLLSAAAFSDIKMSFKGIEMTTATPYSGHFAGYKIEKGKLSVDLDYHVHDRKLEAGHRFVIDQLQLGERVESPDAVHLPLRLAIALLKDRNGVIDINLPVTGSLDDPQFRIGPIVWKAVLNLLTKIATAPFALLGSLFGGGENMNLIDFAPGSAALDTAANEHLTGLLRALKERPQLQLDVPMVYSPDLDGPVLAAKHLQDALLDIKRSESKGRRATDTPLDATILDDPAEHYRLLVALHHAQLGKDAPLPASAQAVETAGKKKADPAAVQAAIAELETAARARSEVPKSDLEALGKNRSEAIQAALLGSGEVDATRVFIITSDPKPGKDNVVRMEMSLK